MDKDNVISEIVQLTVESKKKIMALNSLFNKILEIKVNDLEDGEKENMIFLYCFSYYEKFIKDAYSKVFNYINYLKKKEEIYPIEFNHLSFLYHNLGEKNTRIKCFKEVNNKKFLEHFNLDKFLKDNQKLKSIEELLKFNTSVFDGEIENYINNNTYVSIKTEVKDFDYKDKIRLFIEMYKQRNDKIHGSYQMERKEEMEYVFDLFLVAISCVSNSLVDMLEIKF